MALKTQSELDKLSNDELVSYFDSLPVETFRTNFKSKTKTRYFIAKYGKIFTREIKGANLFFSAVIAQSSMESGFGKSNVCLNANNFGGVRWASTMNNTYFKSGSNKWAKYDTPEKGIIAYINVLKSDRYANARANSKSPEDFILAVAKNGYDNGNPSACLKLCKDKINYTRSLIPIGKIS